MNTTDSAVKEPFDDPPEVPGQLGGLAVAAHAVGLQDHKRLLDQQAERVKQSWQMGMDALGWSEALKKPEDDDMAGDVSVAGDTHIHMVPGHSPPTPAPHPQQPRNSGRWLPWLLAAGLAAGNLAGGAYLFNNLPSAGDDNVTTIGLSTE